MGKNFIYCICIVIYFVFSSAEGLYGRESRGREGRDFIYGSNRDVGLREETTYTGVQGVGGDTGRRRSWDSTGHSSVSQLASRFNTDGSSRGETSQIDDEAGLNQRVAVSAGVPPKKISKYISYREATYSRRAIALGIKNDPNEKQLKIITYLGVEFFDKLREFFKTPIYISSFFRTEALNEAVGGAVYSDHMALDDSAGIDIDMDGKSGPTNNRVFHYILGNMHFYKLIAEFPVNGKLRWLHVSYSTDDEKNRERNTYIAKMVGKRKVYIPYKGNERLVGR